MQNDTSPFLSPSDTRWAQSIVGTFLYYARALDCTLVTALNDISRQQAQPTENVRKKCQQILDYVATYPNAYTRYHSSNMILNIDSDAAYLVLPQAKSRIAGYFYLSDHYTNASSPSINGPILVECKTLRHVVASAAEAEVSAIFHNAQTAIPIRNLLESLGHPQPPTPIKTDNTTANGFVHSNINQKRSKSWDMRFHWLKDKTTQKYINVYWKKGSENDADYFTKHHRTSYHRAMRPRYVLDLLKEKIHNIFSVGYPTVTLPNT